MTAIDWRSVCGERHTKFLTKGTTLAIAKYGDCGRFLLEEFRTFDADRSADRAYRVRDANAVSDAEVRAGKGSPVVGYFDTEAAAVEFCQSCPR